MAMFIQKPWYPQKISTGIYGAEWTIGSSSAWTRTDDASGFADPNPYYANMTDTPSSPFDSIMPWSGMIRVEDSNAGSLVEIPKFWYKWTRTSSKMKLQITADETVATENNFLVSPAHADRGDNVGERDYVYIGRYHCYTNYKSVSRQQPASSVSKANARTGITNLGNDIWQYDFAMWWTIRMLYLVEFADWDSQEKIGYGCGNGSGKQLTGASDTLTYHTGTYRATRQTYGTGVQYRYIEGLWENIYDWLDGIYLRDELIYCTKNPADFPDTAKGVLVGTRPKVAEGYITGWTEPSATGFEYALYPSSVDNTLDGTEYVCDKALYGSSGIMVCGGAYYVTGKAYGAFYLNGNVASGDAKQSRGCRLMVLPPSRLQSA